MNSFRWYAIPGYLLSLVSAAFVQAQPGPPHVGYVYPAGGKQGTTFQVTLGGQFLEGVYKAVITGSGAEAELVEFIKPLNAAQFTMLRDRFKELQNKRAATRGVDGKPSPATKAVWTAADEKELAELRLKLAKGNPQKAQSNPAISESATFEITLAKDAECGEREMRLVTPNGLTNPLVFFVGSLAEFTEQESIEDRELARLAREGKSDKRPNRGKETPRGIKETDMGITLPVVVNGQIMPGTADRYRFKARAGERLVMAASARALIPYLPDAVPGWFQATLTLFDAKGKELAFDDDYRFHPDPVLLYKIPADGEYVIEIRDSIYRGREDFVYRVAIGQLPFVTGIFPLGGKIGEKTTVEVKGWNLPLTSLTPNVQGRGAGIVPLSVRKGYMFSNTVPFVLDTLPEAMEKEPNNQPDAAQQVVLPIVLNGRIDSSGDWDVYRFEGKAGDTVVAEVYARRLDSPLDSILKLTDAAGKQLATNDDFEDKGAGLTTHHADSKLTFTLPATGAYLIWLGDTQYKGGPEYSYRLRLSAPRPDYELRIVPSSIGVRGGATAQLTVFALREDGFNGEIPLVLKDAPSGFTLGGGKIPAGQDRVKVTLTVPPKPMEEPLVLSLEGRATIHGRSVVRPAVPAEDMMQAFAYRHLVPSKELMLAVSDKRVQRQSVKLLSKTPVRIPSGGTATVVMGVPMNTFLGKLQLELSEPPEGLSIKSISPARDGTEILLQCDAAKAKAGLKGNLIVMAFAERGAGKDKPQANQQKRIQIGVMPAIPFEVIERK